ncbi:hypothetical protein KC352_g23417, partial [Hortaea werneckii]
MALKVSSFQSEELINVSQDACTPERTRSSAHVADAANDIAQKSAVAKDSRIQDKTAKSSQTRRTRKTGKGGKLAQESSDVMKNQRVSKPVAKKPNGPRSNGPTQPAVLDVVPRTTQCLSNASLTNKPVQESSKSTQFGSSIGALRAKREGFSSSNPAPKAQTSEITSKLSKTAASGEKAVAERSRQPLQDCDRNTNLSTANDLRDQSKDGVCGKQSNGLSNSLRSANQRQTKEPGPSCGSNDRADDNGNTRLTTAPGALKRTKPKADSLKRPNAPARGSTYRIRESSLEERTSTKPAVVAKSNGATGKSRTGCGASLRSQRQRLPTPKKALANGMQSLIGKQSEICVSDRAPNAVKAISVDHEAQTQAHSKAEKGKRTSRAHDLPLEPPNLYIAPYNKARPDETIEDFEKQVVAYSDHDRFPPVRTKADFNDVSIAPRPLEGKRPGASQQSAILLSDECSSTPSDLVGAPPQTETPTASYRRESRSTMKAPRTPATVQSSPPLENVRSSKTPGTGLTVISRKANIISFGDTGPRNQGSILMKTPAGSAWASRSEKSSSPPWATQALGAGSSRVSIPGRRSQKPPATSSVAASVRTSRTNCSSHSANVASTVDEALAGFFKKKDTHVPSPTKAPRRERAPKISKAGQDEQASHSSDMPANFDDHENAVMINDIDEQNQPARTESQLAMPPPPPKDPKTGKSLPLAAAPNKHSEVREKESSSTKDDASLTSSKKRSAITQDEDRPIAKRIKPTAELSASNLSATKDKGPSAKCCDTQGPNAISAPKIKKAPLEKPTRNPSQGNVDCRGSPVPRGFEVPANATVLEVYSQQANLSSDRLITQHTSNARSQRGTRQNAEAGPLDKHVLPPSHQPEIMSSNTKIRPTSPQEDSQAITGVAIRRVESNSLVIHDAAASPDTDPFTGSKSARKESSKTRPYSNFTQKLFKQAGEAGVDFGHQAG